MTVKKKKKDEGLERDMIYEGQLMRQLKGEGGGALS